MNKLKCANIAHLERKHKSAHKDYEYYKSEFVPRGYGEKSMVSLYEIPPLKSAYPHHYHCKNEETFYIISGEGLLKTPEGEKKVGPEDLIFFHANSAHKMTNTSKTEQLVYLDFDVIHDLDVAIYPDSNKIGIWGKGINKVYKLEEDVGYYDGE